MDRALKYIVLADLVGSTTFTSEFGNDVGIARTREFEKAAREPLAYTLPPTSGKFVKTVGDAVLLVFDHFPDVVSWHLEFQGALQFSGLSEETPHLRKERMEARVWVHAGEVCLEENDLHGLAVNELHKIETSTKAATPGGQVFLTHLAAELARAALYPKNCELKECTEVQMLGRPTIRLYRLSVTSDFGFLIGAQSKARTNVPQ
ncbi:MAG: hypothetical protein IH623_28135 [Verrucomicrobia bacterium]|nr:hypothetical protein [Verrucomicrobiota bacterium]